MLDEFSIGCLAGIMVTLAFVSIAYASHRWRNGKSADVPIEDQRDTCADPDLSVAMIEFSMDRAAEQVVSHGLSLAQRASEFHPSTMWKMVCRPQNGRHEIYVSPGLFGALERLEIATRARRGEKITDVELGVLHGVIKPMRFRKDVQPEFFPNSEATSRANV